MRDQTGRAGVPLHPDLIERAGHKINRKPSREQLRVGKLQAIGKGGKEIAFLLGVTEKTVSAHAYQLHRKLGVRNVAELIWQLTQLGESPYRFADATPAMDSVERDILSQPRRRRRNRVE